MLVPLLVLGMGSGWIAAEAPVLRLRAAVVGAPSDVRLAIDLLRWSSDSEREAAMAALTAPPPPPPARPAAPAGGRGGRGARGALPVSGPGARLTAAIKGAPTLGFIWGDGPTGYSIRYAWRAALPDGRERVVIVTDRRMGVHSMSWPVAPRAAADEDFTVIEMRVGRGGGEGRASLSTGVRVDGTARTLALETYEAAPVLFKVTR